MSGTTISSEHLTPLQKKLLIRSWHRGTKEMDLLLGGFADKYIATFSAQECADYEEMIAALDADMLNWVTDVEPVPDAQNTLMWQRFYKDVANV